MRYVKAPSTTFKRDLPIEGSQYPNPPLRPHDGSPQKSNKDAEEYKKYFTKKGQYLRHQYVRQAVPLYIKPSC